MEQMQVSAEKVITVNFENQDLPTSVQQFKPIIYKEGDKYFVVLGPDAEEGIAGTGDTLKDALLNWDIQLTGEIDNPREGNETTRYVLDNLNTF